MVEVEWRDRTILAVTWGQMEEIRIREGGVIRRELGLGETRILAISMAYRSLVFSLEALSGKLVDWAILEEEQEEIVEAESARSQLAEADGLDKSS